MKTEESAENYLETILVLHNRNREVRSIDISREMGFTKASVSVAMKNLRQKGYITVDENGYIQFTEAGRNKAFMVYERHTTIKQLLMGLGVNETIAAEDACRIEHVISEESFNAIKKVLEKNI